MKKIAAYFGLILLVINGLFVLPAYAVEQNPVEVQIDTKKEGKLVPGTENVDFAVYDLSNWRHTNDRTEKEAMGFLMDEQVTKEKMQEFVAAEQLQVVHESIRVDREGKAVFTVERYQNKKDAAYLVLAKNETSDQLLLPIVIYLPQYYLDTENESNQLLIYGKYADKEVPQEPKKEEPPTRTEVVQKTTELTQGLPSSSKSYPQTNDVATNGIVLGGLVLLLAAMGLIKTNLGGNKE
ncbi:hypothetical protein NRIC_26160 [Enterococcus florum]|uniref:Gram-positive pilin subunit D1 N-terminal domain-containing protein n=1 Tax=Enterococcus florum TaxID=2480627 RepID=A0A4P5P9G6_9ENTE|nr:pilin N-terminal domain-containing protein [Enterococcus florum]GCF94725.1 hypothetical protein NRIC_26160 [Enterococcus florum]